MTAPGATRSGDSLEDEEPRTKTVRADPNVREAIRLAAEVADGAHAVLSSAEYKADEVTRWCAMLAATIVDGLHAAVALIPSHGQAHADTVVRSMIEAVGDLHHLVADAAYLDRLKLTSALNVKAAGEEMIRVRIDDASAAGVVHVAKERCQEAKQVIRRLCDTVEKLSVADRITAPGLPSDVAGIYEQYCFDAHHDLSALERRHFRDTHIVMGDETLHAGSAIGTLGHATLLVAMVLDVAPKFATIRDPDLRATAIRAVAIAAELNAMAHAAFEPLRRKVAAKMAGSVSTTKP